MLKVNNKDTRTTSFCIFSVNFEHISHSLLMILLLTLNMYLSVGKRCQHMSFSCLYFYPRTNSAKNSAHQFSTLIYNFQHVFFSELILQPLTFVAKHFILDVCRSPRYVSTMLNFILLFNFFITEVRIIYKPVHWFALQNNGLVSVL